MASACALAIFSGMIILNFGFQESLRTFLKPIFTGGVVTANGICSACFLWKRRRGGSVLALSVFASQIQLSQGESPWHGGKVSGRTAK